MGLGLSPNLVCTEPEMQLFGSVLGHIDPLGPKSLEKIIIHQWVGEGWDGTARLFVLLISSGDGACVVQDVGGEAQGLPGVLGFRSGSRRDQSRSLE